MSLGPQCWRCKQRRVRCDSAQPSCRRCDAAGAECPGYGHKKPVRWRKVLVPTTDTLEPQSTSDLFRPQKQTTVRAYSLPVPRSPKTKGLDQELRITADALHYFNLHFVSHLVPYQTKHNPHIMPVDRLGDMPEFFRHCYVSVAASHRLAACKDTPKAWRPTATTTFPVIRPAPNPDSLSESLSEGDYRTLIFASQARMLNCLVSILRQRSLDGNEQADPMILAFIMMMIMTQIQISSFSQWHAHIVGAHTLVDTWGGPQTLIEQRPPTRGLVYTLLLLDTISTTTRKITPQLAAEVIARQKSYIDLFGGENFGRDVFRTATPIPGNMISVMVLVNLLRARLRLWSGSNTDEYIKIFDSLDAVQLESLADTAASVTITARMHDATSPDPNLQDIEKRQDDDTKKAWRALLTAQRSALIIYAVCSIAGFGTSNARLENLNRTTASNDLSLVLLTKETMAYNALLESFSVIFNQRDERHATLLSATVPSDSFYGTSAGLLHKFMLWPLVIGGIHASLVALDKLNVESICEKMRSVGKELGTYGMLDGAQFIENVPRPEREEHLVARAWDDIFEGRPIFFL